MNPEDHDHELDLEAVQAVAQRVLPGFDEDLLGYISAVLLEMSVDERRSAAVMSEAVAPFLVDADYATEQVTVAFGGSGYKGSGSGGGSAEEDATPELLSAPVRIKELGSHLLEEKKTYGGVVFADAEGETGGNSNSALNMSSMPATLRQKKRAKKEEELLQRKLRAEAAREAEERRVMASARMAAIRANRVAGKTAKSGYSLDRFSIPHPSGTGNLLEDVSLTLSSQRRYGLIGKNGSGKT
jgi:ABC-type multidrug transport system fused ATPase/permease subunit